MSISLIVSLLVVVTGFGLASSERPRWSFQPATTTPDCRRGPQASLLLLLAAVSQSDDDRNGVVEALRTLGVLRDPNPPPTVGRRAYVRWWERTRAALFLVAVLVGLGVVLAAVVGVTVLIAGFLLEQAIS